MRLVATFAVVAVALGAASSAAAAGDPAAGRALFQEGCSSCHGLDARGVHDRGPSLRGVGAIAADFYLSTGRMPLDQQGRQPDRTEPAYTRAQIADLVAYVASFGGPGIPHVDAKGGSLSEGQRLFTDSCAPCHQIVGRGGNVNGAFSPTLRAPTATQVAEAVRIGPYVMPVFDAKQLNAHELDSIARYVAWTKRPQDSGGWGIFEIGPVPEGMISWLLAGVVLLIVMRFLGERDTE